MDIWHIWIIAALVLVIIEIFTTGFVVICFGFGAVFGAIAAGAGASLVWQIVAFTVATAATFVFIRPLVQKMFFRRNEVRTNAQAIIGRICTVTEDIDNELQTGLVKIDGDIWKAVSEDGSVLLRGDKARVTSRDGLTLTITKIQ